MSGYRLPDGVPPDNQQTETKPSFVAPDTATPGFAHERKTSEDEFQNSYNDMLAGQTAAPAPATRQPSVSRRQARFTIALALVVLLFAAVSLGAFLSNQHRLPLCSEQPDWNQYNCIPG